jgi:hypothetical protein
MPRVLQIPTAAAGTVAEREKPDERREGCTGAMGYAIRALVGSGQAGEPQNSSR